VFLIKDTEADFDNELFTYNTLQDYHINKAFKYFIVTLLYNNSQGSADGTVTKIQAA
jgi:hypothetical protein